jgi:gag-polypeptide of LTR copia-type/GAG-pre-integrase domain
MSSSYVELKSYSIEKFSGKNFHIWKKMVRNLLIDENLWKYVDPKTNIDDMDKEEFVKHDEKAGRLILKTISWEEIHNVLHSDSGREIWQILLSIYEGDSLTHVVNIKREFYNSRYEDGQDLQAHLSKIRKAGDQIRSLGYSLNEEELCHVVLASLPRSFDNVTVALGRADLTWNTMTSQLRLEVLRRDEEKPAEGGINYMGREQQKSADKQKQSQPRSDQQTRQCYICQRTGHIAKWCFFNPNGQNYKGQKWVKHDEGNKGNEKRDNNEDAKVMLEDEDEEVIAAIMHENDDDYEEVIVAVRNDKSEIGGKWIVDSGASRHFSSQRHLFRNLRNVQPVNVRLGDNKRVTAAKAGEINLQVENEGEIKVLKLKNVLYAEEIKINLISVAEIYKCDQSVQFHKTGVKIIDEMGRMITDAYEKRGLYWVETINNKEVGLNVAATENTDDIWHMRFGHVHDKGLKRLVDESMVRGMEKFKESKQCMTCAEGKITRSPLTATHGIQTVKTLDLLHVDLCGPMICN